MRSGRVFLVSWIILFGLSAVWAISNPIGAAPDEPAHLIKAASVAHGQLSGTPSDLGQVVQVPRYVQYSSAQTCFAFQPDTPASCIAAAPAGDPAQMVDAVTSAGLYNPVYYALVGWPSLLVGDSAGIYLMRLASAAICSMLLAAAVAMIAGWRRPGPPMIGLIVATTPMVVYLNSSLNPNALEVSAVIALFVGMLGIVLDRRSDLLGWRAFVVAIAAAAAVNARGLSPLWVAVAIGVPLLLIPRREVAILLRRMPVRALIAVTAVSTALALGWLLRSNSLAAGIDDPSTALAAPGVGTSAISGFLTTLDRTFGLGLGLVGVFGWLDTPAPEVVFFLWATMIGGLVVCALALLRGRRLIVSILLMAVVLLLPPLVQGAYINGGGFIWQGRYTLPAFVCLVIGTAALLGATLPKIEGERSFRRLLVVVVSIWGGSQFYALITNLKRYTAGSDASWREALLEPEWSPPGGALVWIFAGMVVIGVACLLLMKTSPGHAPESGSPVLTDLRERATPDAGGQGKSRARPGRGSVPRGARESRAP